MERNVHQVNELSISRPVGMESWSRSGRPRLRGGRRVSGHALFVLPISGTSRARSTLATAVLGRLSA